MREKQNTALELEGLDEPGINEPEEVKKIQMERNGICYAVADVLESIYGDNLEVEHPQTVDGEQSVLVAKLDFGNDLKTELFVPYEGKAQISNPEIEYVFTRFRDRLRKALVKYVKDPDRVIKERF